jgi:hypothetical protein
MVHPREPPVGEQRADLSGGSVNERALLPAEERLARDAV